MVDAETTAQTARLVREMQAGMQVPLSPLVERAFLRVPRGHFVPSYLTPALRTGGADWSRARRVSAPSTAWQKAVYSDAALVTEVMDGMPSSSSTMPSIMAAMIDALELRPGQRVLEIGTGTGYNAAVLAHCVGPSGQVSSIEHQGNLAQRAHERLQSAALPTAVTVHHGDGLFGDEEHAPFDRIMATASAPRIPKPWLQQLAVGGRLIADLRGGLAGSLLLLSRDDDDSYSGHFLHDIDAAFMALAEPGSEDGHRMLEELLRMPQQDAGFPDALDPRLIMSDESRETAWFTQWEFPSAHYTERSVEGRDELCLLSSDDRTLLRFVAAGDPPAWTAWVHGADPRILDRLVEVVQWWDAAGQPSRRQCRWTGRQDGAQAIEFLQAHGSIMRRWPL
jgi:protein-L-isoaspartate(D-aspartate) O-methyltransferase